jgi:toxin YoeB
MEIKLMPQAEEDLVYWKSTGNKQVMKRITKLLEDILLHPFTGIGKPEPLKGNLQGVWSRRITDEHRLLYSVSNGMVYVYVLSLRFHYSK